MKTRKKKDVSRCWVIMLVDVHIKDFIGSQFIIMRNNTPLNVILLGRHL